MGVERVQRAADEAVRFAARDYPMAARADGVAA